MLDEVIKAFLLERKNAKLKGVTDVEQIQKIENTFHPENWLSEAAKRASQLSLVSHPSKFTHPSAKTSSIIFESTFIADGFLRSGNVDSELDVFGNAAAMDVYKFLSLTLADGKTVLAHLEENTDFIQQQFKFASISFDELRDNFLAIKQDKFSTVHTSGQIKQVYFPVDDGYHLLSVLTPSGLMFKLKERLYTIRPTKEIRDAEKNNVFDEHGFDELRDLTIIGFGGTKPQNISVLNSKNYGEAYLLLSVPPSLKPRDIQPPSSDFFKNSIYPKLYKASFNRFNYLVNPEFEHVKNNIDNRDERDDIICAVIDNVIVRAWAFRQIDAGWSNKTTLPHYQKVWLDNAFTEERENSDEWSEKIVDELARWFISSYEKLHKQILASEDLIRIKSTIEENRDNLL
ncbi:MAG: type I-F CRISPR-associated protein Csy1 [Methylococcales bacterium]|nr:type I-F CRISPR-associated protein Csy1 [Methylococcales bacterium]